MVESDVASSSAAEEYTAERHADDIDNIEKSSSSRSNRRLTFSLVPVVKGGGRARGRGNAGKGRGKGQGRGGMAGGRRAGGRGRRGRKAQEAILEDEEDEATPSEGSVDDQASHVESVGPSDVKHSASTETTQLGSSSNVLGLRKTRSKANASASTSSCIAEVVSTDVCENSRSLISVVHSRSADTAKEMSSSSKMLDTKRTRRKAKSTASTASSSGEDKEDPEGSEDSQSVGSVTVEHSRSADRAKELSSSSKVLATRSTRSKAKGLSSTALSVAEDREEVVSTEGSEGCLGLVAVEQGRSTDTAKELSSSSKLLATKRTQSKAKGRTQSKAKGIASVASSTSGSTEGTGDIQGPSAQSVGSIPMDHSESTDTAKKLGSSSKILASRRTRNKGKNLGSTVSSTCEDRDEVSSTEASEDSQGPRPESVHPMAVGHSVSTDTGKELCSSSKVVAPRKTRSKAKGLSASKASSTIGDGEEEASNEGSEGSQSTCAESVASIPIEPSKSTDTTKELGSSSKILASRKTRGKGKNTPSSASKEMVPDEGNDSNQGPPITESMDSVATKHSSSTATTELGSSSNILSGRKTRRKAKGVQCFSEEKTDAAPSEDSEDTQSLHVVPVDSISTDTTKELGCSRKLLSTRSTRSKVKSATSSTSSPSKATSVTSSVSMEPGPRKQVDLSVETLDDITAPSKRPRRGKESSIDSSMRRSLKRPPPIEEESISNKRAKTSVDIVEDSPDSDHPTSNQSGTASTSSASVQPGPMSSGIKLAQEIRTRQGKKSNVYLGKPSTTNPSIIHMDMTGSGFVGPASTDSSPFTPPQGAARKGGTAGTDSEYTAVVTSPKVGVRHVREVEKSQGRNNATSTEDASSQDVGVEKSPAKCNLLKGKLYLFV